MTLHVSTTEKEFTPVTLRGRPAGVRSCVFRSFEELPPAYVALFEQNGSSSLFYSAAWFRNLAQTALDPGEQIRIYGVEREDPVSTPVAAIPMRCIPPPVAWWKPRTLCGLSNFYSCLFGPMLHPGFPLEEALPFLISTICSQGPSWDIVDLSPLDQNSLVFAQLERAFQAVGMVTQTYFCFGSWYYPVNGRSYQEYLHTLRSSVRNIAKSKNKKVERSGRVRVQILTGLEGLEAGIEAYLKVYGASWKIPEPYPGFIPGLIRLCAETGWLRLGVAYVDDEPAAAQLWMVSNGVASIYKIAYDQRFAELSVGTYLSTRLLEHVIDVDKVREVDYLSGDDKYKSDWMSHRRERWGIMAFNPRTLKGALAIARHVGGRKAKRGLGRILRALIRAETDVRPK
jgi:hypothetical protein